MLLPCPRQSEPGLMLSGLQLCGLLQMQRRALSGLTVQRSWHLCRSDGRPGLLTRVRECGCRYRAPARHLRDEVFQGVTRPLLLFVLQHEAEELHQESDSVRAGPERPQIPDDRRFGPRSRLKLQPCVVQQGEAMVWLCMVLRCAEHEC
eukprot:s3556_g6.t1